MKIGVMSDTHGSLLYFNKAMNYLKDCDILLHGGDILYHGPRNPIPEGYNPGELFEEINKLENLIIAKGNCDSDVDQMVLNHPIQNSYVVSQFGEVRIILTHGYIDSKEEMIKRAKALNGDILIFGHTHVKELFVDENLIVMNPGSTTLPKDGSHTVGIIEVDQSHDELDMNFYFIDINSGEKLQFSEE